MNTQTGSPVTAQHTPGPWKYERFQTTADTWLIERRDSGRKSFIAETHCTLGHGGNAEANARLIAAAPELLAALEACEKHMTHSLVELNQGNGGMVSATHRARAAVAKAKGLTRGVS